MESKRILFTKREKDFLKRLVAKYADVIESKKTDGQTIKNKSETWNKIEYEFNFSCFEDHNKRTAKQLKKLWDNIKCEKRKKERFLTDGGQPEKDPLALDDHTNYIPSGAYAEENAVSMSKVGNYIYDSGTNLQPSSSEETIEVPVEVLVNENGASFDIAAINAATFERGEISQSTTSRTKKRKETDYIRDEGVIITNEQQKLIHTLTVEELQNKVKLSKLAVEAKEQEMRQSAEAFRAEMAYKENKWKLELEILQKQIN